MLYSIMDITIEAWLGIVMLTFFFMYATLKQRHRGLPLPPSPPSLPLIGHLHLLSHLPHHDLGCLSIRYGPLFFIRLGYVKCVVVSSPQMVMEVFKTHDVSFASRPSLELLGILSYNYKGIIAAPYGEDWKHLRKMITVHLFTTRRLQETRHIRSEEISCIMQSIMQNSAANRVVDLNSKFSKLASNVIMRITIGRKLFGEGTVEGADPFKKLVHEVTHLGGLFNIGDFFPCLSRFDLQGYKRRMEMAHLKLDTLLERILEEELQKSADGNKEEENLVTVLLQVGQEGREEKLEHKTIKAIIQDMILAGTDTISVTLEWAVAELLRSPWVMKKAQQELDEVVGFERWVEEEDISKLKYLQAIAKETFRLHPAAPLLGPRESIQDCEIAGYHIPKGTRLMVNAWQMGRDSRIWKNPEVFNPDRFAKSSIDVKGRDFELTPFGGGKRICPGMPLGLSMVHIVLARLLQAFHLEAAEDVDISEKFGATMPMAKPLLALATPRLNMPFHS